jgi:hypothetical protein
MFTIVEKSYTSVIDHCQMLDSFKDLESYVSCLMQNNL